MSLSFGEFLHSIRIRTKGTQLAKIVGISYVYLLDIEKGARPVPSNTVLMALADNLPFNLGERERFFDLAATENGCAPLDVSNYLCEHWELVEIIRRIKCNELSEDCLRSIIESVNHGTGEKSNE